MHVEPSKTLKDFKKKYDAILVGGSFTNKSYLKLKIDKTGNFYFGLRCHVVRSSPYVIIVGVVARIATLNGWGKLEGVATPIHKEGRIKLLKGSFKGACTFPWRNIDQSRLSTYFGIQVTLGKDDVYKFINIIETANIGKSLINHIENRLQIKIGLAGVMARPNLIEAVNDYIRVAGLDNSDGVEIFHKKELPDNVVGLKGGNVVPFPGLKLISPKRT